MHRTGIAALVLLFALPAHAQVPASKPATPIQFDRDIRPILSENCYACHGPDANKRKAKLRLDIRDGSVLKNSVIVPGKPDESSLVERITSDDPEEIMPPPKSEKKLTPTQVDLLKRWVAAGAEYKGHWAYERPVKHDAPGSPGPNAIDAFIRAKLAEVGMKPSAEADRVTLIRRLSFDLTGLPATPAEVDAFVNDKSPNAYEKVVDRLIASPHFGERMAMAWLDWVRYADTAGYHSDNEREVWLFRDYVINSFNTNKPFDVFTTEQIAGDLLPNPTREQKIASGYNRMLLTTEEGGAQAKEYTAKYAADRVRNASTVWLGATLGCAECHDHKFDPYTTKDFYRFAAFFADVDEIAVGRQSPTKLPTTEQQAKMDAIDKQLAALKTTLDTQTPALSDAQTVWEKSVGAPTERWAVVVPKAVKSQGGTPFKIGKDSVVSAEGKAAETDTYTVELATDQKKITAIRLEVFPDASLPANGPGRASNGNFVLNQFQLLRGGKPVALTNATATYSQPGYDVAGAIDTKGASGWATMGQAGKQNEAVFELKEDLLVNDGKPLDLSVKMVMRYGSGHVIGKFRLAVTDATRPVKAGEVGGIPGNVRESLATPAPKRSPAQAQTIAAYYRTIAPALEPTRKALAATQKERDDLAAGSPTMLVTKSLDNPRMVRVLPRGNWLDESGTPLTPAIPGFLGAEIQGRRANRLDLAKWLTSVDNPLVARVFVNRVWKIAFGQGLVTSLEDFGAQGALPTHPELLDYLAVSFREGGWNVKALVKQLVMSETYRQSSVPSESLKDVDPANQWVARQGRFRLDAEFVRDDMLVVSGLLIPKVGGPSAKPYQPAGYWAHLNFPKREYVNDRGEGLYRRGMYTFWQRTFPHPSLLTFDAPTREECTAQRNRSNTPLQALVLLNDPIYVEGARAFAEKVLRDGGKDFEPRLDFAFRWAVSRTPRTAEKQIIAELFQKHRDYFKTHAKEADEFLHVGDKVVPADLDRAELAAWTSVARAILNLHETITRN